MNSRPEVNTASGAAPYLKEAGAPRARWRQWGDYLRSRQLDGIVAWLLDAGRPLSLLSAQLLYIGRPFLGAEADRLASLLESDEEAAAFARYLDSGVDLPSSPPGESH